MRKLVEDVEVPQRVKSIQFGMFDSKEIMGLSHVQIVHQELYQQPRRTPLPHGALDTRLGISDKAYTCGTCQKKVTDCVGHFGNIKLVLPVFHTGYLKNIISILQMICKKCARIMLEEEEIQAFLKKVRRPNVEPYIRRNLAKLIMKNAKKNGKSLCKHCNAYNGTVKKLNAFKIIHEKYKGKKVPEMDTSNFIAQFDDAVKANPELAMHLSKAQEDLNPIKVLSLFKQITSSDCELLNLDPVDGRPERLIMTHLLVPPVCIRPSVAMDTQGSNEDDLTIKLSEINFLNDSISLLVEKGIAITSIMENWDHLQLQCAMYINSEIPGIPLAMRPSKPIRGLSQRLKGKTGRFRGNLSGKRVDFTSRTVISPDPNLRIEEVAVPFQVASILTYPERVNDANVTRLRQYVSNGPDKYPGANYVEYPDGEKRHLKYGQRNKIAADLKIGDIVERHLIDGDVVLFNRQPSLHKLSIMAHRARVMHWRTFRFNECVCTPYNADFDGDEMNLHLPQTEEARAEAMILMGVTNNLITPRNGEPLISAIQDFLTASYLISRKDTFFDRSQFCKMCTFMGDGFEKIDLPPPAILKPVELWTGKQIFGVVIRPSRKSHILVNLEAKSRTYGGKGEHTDINDGWVCFHNSELMSGTIDKAIIGSGSKNSLFHALLRDYSPTIAANTMSRLAKLCARFLGDHGFSIGIPDVKPSEKLSNLKTNLVNGGYKICEDLISLYNDNKLTPQSGCSVEQTLESRMTGELSEIRDKAGKSCVQNLPFTNSPLIMALCGSKGSNINISQMIACVGQQTVNGARIPNGFINRTLPHFEINAKDPPAKGFVKNSFFTGMTGTEFFMHTMGGREGLVDTAVKTADTGYMQRRLVKALEDLSTQYDYTVRDSGGTIVQFIYGDDGLDPAGMEAKDRPVDFARLLVCVRNTKPCKNEQALLPHQIEEEVEKLLSDEKFANCSELFMAELKNFFVSKGGCIDTLTKIRQDLGLPIDVYLPKLNGDMKGKSVEEKKNGIKSDNTDKKVEEKKGNKKDDVKNEASVIKKQDNENESENADENGNGQKRKFAILDKEELASRLYRITSSHLKIFLDICVDKYLRAKTEPGTAVGALGAQSIGEPGTQMTLKTFHFAGVASMNVTLGVPRIKEIINASKNISTPIITAHLQNETNLTSARYIKGLIEKTTLGEVCKHMKEVYKPDRCYLSVSLDKSTIQALQLSVTPDSVKKSIINHKKSKVKDENVVSYNDKFKLRIFPTEKTREKLLFSLHNLKNLLPNVIVSGIPSVERAIVNDITKEKDGDTKKYNILVEGYNLAKVMVAPGIKSTHTTSNHIMEVEKCLGIEAARVTIINEIQYTMQSHGMSIDQRHVMLLADIMSCKGKILGITRFGVAEMKESVLMLASFEKTMDHLFDAAIHHRKDVVEGVSECIIMGRPIPIGTGMFKMLQQPVKATLPRRPLLLED